MRNRRRKAFSVGDGVVQLSCGVETVGEVVRCIRDGEYGVRFLDGRQRVVWSSTLVLLDRRTFWHVLMNEDDPFG